MDFFLLGVTLLVAVQTIWDAWRAGPDDPTWDLRRRALSPDDQARLAIAGLSRTSTAALADPEERELAEGFGRRENRRRAYLELALLGALALVAALMLAGVASFSLAVLIIAAYGMLRWPLESWRDRQIKRKLRSKAEPAVTTAP